MIVYLTRRHKYYSNHMNYCEDDRKRALEKLRVYIIVQYIPRLLKCLYFLYDKP